MTVSLGSSFASEGFVYLLTCGRRSLVSGTQNEIVVSWMTLWGMIKVYWLDFSLHFRSCCLLRVCRKFRPKLANIRPVKNGLKWCMCKRLPWLHIGHFATGLAETTRGQGHQVPDCQHSVYGPFCPSLWNTTPISCVGVGWGGGGGVGGSSELNKQQIK